jgi:hypothetical protein
MAVPGQVKNRVHTILLRIRDNAVELQNIAGEMEGFKAIFLEGIASRIINLIDIALKEI